MVRLIENNQTKRYPIKRDAQDYLEKDPPTRQRTIYTTHVEILYLYIIYTHGTARAETSDSIAPT